MAELLWLFGEMSPLLRPLVFTVRNWARSQGILKSELVLRWWQFLLDLYQSESGAYWQTR